MSGNSNLHYRQKRMRASCPSASDIISDLPGNIIDNILTCLPIRDAVRTSILSRKWRFKWLDLSQLVLTTPSAKDHLESHPSRKVKSLLRHLNLSYCVFKPPHAFEGLSNLISLELDDCFPNLTVFCFSGTFKPISFKNAPLLVTVRIESVYNGNVESVRRGEILMQLSGNSNAVEVLGCLPAIKRLVICCSFIKYLSVGNIPLRLPTTLNRLKSLELPAIYFNCIDDVRFALCLIKSSPNLKKLKIELFQTMDDNIDPILQLLEA
ncbi:F-box/FBD/LRR-repeat protein At5g44980-like [Tripterygium wilfordii]|uniref:F-box/FBD/LRR-repeat protein At5g44980-like n=1 Tax=Tripterygium wilfordii TaxID=458696 RepID=UPI0018F81B67|nr:F-box/FBD/LRR-repeat protein At5g44980-like [Tripterygium wilfordii]